MEPLILTKAKASLILSHPFFASILLHSALVSTDKVPTLAVDARGKIYYNPEFMAKLIVPQLVWGLAHECLHKMLDHAGRRGHREHGKWNYACDAVINDTLTTSKVGEPIPHCVDMPGSKDKTSEEVYNELPESPSGSSPMDGDGLGDDLHDDPTMSEAERSEIEVTIKIQIAQAAQAARMQGKMPASLQRLVDEILNVKTPWFDILERHMTGLVKSDYTWSRPNRRYIGAGHYLPSMNSTPAMGEMVLVVDTSGSIGSDEMNMFAGHMNRILETCKPAKLHVVYCDAAVGSVDEYTPDDLPAVFKTPSGGGGTDFKPPFDWVDEQGLQPDCLVYLTDGYGDFPEQPSYPTIWLMTTDVQAPFGEVVRFEE